MNWRRARVPALWFGCVAVASVIVARAHYITDLSAFLPAKPTAAQQLLVDQLRDGPASRLILIAIEFLRRDDRGGMLGLSTSQLLGIAMVGLAALIHVRLGRESARNGGATVAAPGDGCYAPPDDGSAHSRRQAAGGGS